MLIEFCTKRPLFVESMLNFHSSVMAPGDVRPDGLDRPTSKWTQAASRSPQPKRPSTSMASQSHRLTTFNEKSERKSPPRSLANPTQEVWNGVVSAARQAISDLLTTAKVCLCRGAYSSPVNYSHSLSGCSQCV